MQWSRASMKRRWPVWLNEDFADYMANACDAARRDFSPGLNPHILRQATMTATELMAVSRYREDPDSVVALYEIGTKFVRYLFTKYPAERFRQFVDRLLDGTPSFDRTRRSLWR